MMDKLGSSFAYKILSFLKYFRSQVRFLLHNQFYYNLYIMSYIKSSLKSQIAGNESGLVGI